VLPGAFGIAEHATYEHSAGIVSRFRIAWRGLTLRRIALQHLRAVDDRHRIDAEKVRRSQRQHDGADAYRSPADAKAARAPPVFDVLTFTFIIEAHVGSPCVRASCVSGKPVSYPRAPRILHRTQVKLRPRIPLQSV